MEDTKKQEAPDGKHDVKHGHHHEKRAGTHDHNAKPQAGANLKKDAKKEGKQEDKVAKRKTQQTTTTATPRGGDVEDVSLEDLGLNPPAVKKLWKSIKTKPNRCGPKLYQHGPAFGLCSKDPGCVAAHMMLSAAGMDYTTVNCDNDEMSPSGELPFLRLYNDSLHVETSGIAEYLATLKLNTDATLDTTETGETTAYAGLITSRLIPAYRHELWCEDSSFQDIARPVYGVAQYPWPLDFILCKVRQFEVWKTVFPIGQLRNQDKLYFDAGCAYKALSEKLVDKPFLFGDRPTYVDAMMYGHLSVILNSNLPSNNLKPKITDCDNLVRFCHRVESEYPSLGNL